MILAHIAGVPVEEFGQPVLIALLLSGTWLGTRLRRRQTSAGHAGEAERTTPGDA
jgi:hypothetical protein